MWEWMEACMQGFIAVRWRHICMHNKLWACKYECTIIICENAYNKCMQITLQSIADCKLQFAALVMKKTEQ